jgi:glyoxylase-like metal-dependent hydrolase (beta-lactamase superfamily II)
VNTTRIEAALAFAAAAVVSIGLAAAPRGAQGTSAPQRQSFDIRALPVQGFNTTRMYMLVGAGGNIAVQIGEEGVLLVDTGTAPASDAVMAAIRTLTDKPIRYIVNTHAHPDHVGGNAAIVKASGGQRTDVGGGNGGPVNPDGVIVVAHQNTVDQMLSPPRGQMPYPEFAVAQSSFYTADKQLHFNGEAVEMWWHPSAHTNGDILVYFPRSDVVVAGDFLHTETYPIFEVAAGGRLQGMLNGLNQIIDLAVPQFNQVGGTRIVPGHGRLCTESDVVELRDMATIVRDRIQYMIRKNMTLEQVKAARPTADYDPVYGTSTGMWSTDRFIETVYADLKKPWNGPEPAAKPGLNFIDGGR